MGTVRCVVVWNNVPVYFVGCVMSNRSELGDCGHWERTAVSGQQWSGVGGRQPLIYGTSPSVVGRFLTNTE